MQLRKLNQAESAVLTQIENKEPVNPDKLLKTLAIGLETINELLVLRSGSADYKYALFIKSIIYSLYTSGGYAIHPSLDNTNTNYIDQVSNFEIDEARLEQMITMLPNYKLLTVVYANGSEENFPTRQFFATLMGLSNRALIEP